jgi:hypothetical protein
MGKRIDYSNAKYQLPARLNPKSYVGGRMQEFGEFIFNRLKNKGVPTSTPTTVPQKTFDDYLQEARTRLTGSTSTANTNVGPAPLDWLANSPWAKSNQAPAVYPPTTGPIITTPVMKPADPLNM